MIHQSNSEGKHILLLSSILVALEMSSQYKACTQTGMFTLLHATLMLEHTMSWLVDVSGWRSMFSFPKSHRQMYWVAVPHMTSQLPEGNLMHVDEKLVISVIPPQQWCTHLKMHMIAMHALHKLLLLHYDAWASWHLTQFGRPHFLTRAFTNLCSSEPILFLADIDKVFRLSLKDFSSMPFHHVCWPHFFGFLI